MKFPAEKGCALRRKTAADHLSWAAKPLDQKQRGNRFAGKIKMGRPCL
jgi:hypothetical protein